jgi:hypothetical protein
MIFSPAWCSNYNYLTTKLTVQENNDIMNSSGRAQVQGQMFQEGVPTFDFNYTRHYDISDIHLFSKPPTPALGSIQPPIRWLQEFINGGYAARV